MNREEIQKYIEEFISRLGAEFDSVDIENLLEQDVFRIRTKESNKLIGSGGDVLRSLNHIIKQTLKSRDVDTKFILDINDYRTKQIEEIQNTAKLLAQRAQSLKYDVEMQPMSSYERMIVHASLDETENITTESIGVGRDRRVVIKYVA